MAIKGTAFSNSPTVTDNRQILEAQIGTGAIIDCGRRRTKRFYVSAAAPIVPACFRGPPPSPPPPGVSMDTAAAARTQNTATATEGGGGVYRQMWASSVKRVSLSSPPPKNVLDSVAEVSRARNIPGLHLKSALSHHGVRAVRPGRDGVGGERDAA